MTREEDERWMRRALRLAVRGAGRTSPNPMVGAVVVKDGAAVAEGYHRRAGEPHGELEALRRAGEAARGATLYLNLEPCVHQGRTPPCVDAVLAAGIGRVVAAMRDPDPRVDGRGFRQLRSAGVEVEHGVLEAEARRLNEGFISRLQQGRPFVLLKLATTLDGRVAVQGRRYLSGKAALKEVHRLRDRLDAVMVGVGTVLADDPELTVREVRGRDPLRVVLDAEARTPPAARVVRGSDPQRTIVFVARNADQRRTKRLRDAGALVATLPRSPGGEGLDIAAGLRWLAEHGVNSVLAEGGPRVAASLLREKLVDRVLFVVAPVAGGQGPHAFEEVAPVELGGLRVRRAGADLLLEAEIPGGSSGGGASR